MKDVNPDEARIKNEQNTVLETMHPNELTLNVTNLNALQVADTILKYLNSLKVKN